MQPMPGRSSWSWCPFCGYEEYVETKYDDDPETDEEED
jgi:hypothetical protein